MATKTISLEIDAYEKLERARRSPRESFSSVIRRAKWEDTPPDAGEIFDYWTDLAKKHPKAILDEETLDWMDRRERTARRTTAWDR